MRRGFGANGITPTSPESQTITKASFDENDDVMLEGRKPSNFTQAFENQGTGAFKVTTKLNGRPFVGDLSASRGLPFA